MIGRRLLWTALILSAVVLVDLGTKQVVRRTLPVSSPQYYLDGLLRISRWENAGTFMSIGHALPAPARFWMFTIAAGVFAAGLIIFISTRPSLSPAQVIAGSLIASGTASNIMDRLLHDGRALDFINVVAAPLHLMIFNLADVAIALGGIMLFAAMLRRRVRHSAGQRTRR